jgi:hypothetical protein
MLRLTNAAYDFLKPIALIWLPAAATAYAAIAAILGLGNVAAVVGIISAADGFLGAVLHLSTNPANPTTPASGQLVINKTDSGEKSVYLVLESELEDLEKNKTITLTVTPKT